MSSETRHDAPASETPADATGAAEGRGGAEEAAAEQTAADAAVTAEAAEAAVAAEAAEAAVAAEAAEAAVAAAAAPISDEPLSSRERDLTDQLKRLAAEFANYQKRVQRDRAKWTQDAVRELLKDLLPVLDNLDQAVAAFHGEVKDPEVYRKGVDLVREELTRHLRSYQVERIEAEEGTPFDPDLHEAIMVQEADDVDASAVAFVARAGYRVGDIVLRPAQVGVKKPRSG